MSNNKTIAEIAQLAGVGTATVDRVLNQRPGVAAETAEKVMEAMKSMGVATPMRGRPRKALNYRLAFVLPANRTPFFDLVDRVIAQTAGDFRHQHITEITYRFDPTDPVKFAKDLSKLDDCDCVALLAPDLPAIKLAVNELVRAGVHVVTLLSDIPGALKGGHIGVDNRAAGRTAGLLMGRSIGHGRQAKVLLASQPTRFSSEIDRRVGFAQIIEERYPEVELVRLQDLPEDEAGAREVCAALFGDSAIRATLAGVYNVGSGTYGILKACQDAGFGPDFTSITHDLTEVNKTLLTSGALSYVLHQDIHYCILAAAKSLLSLRENLRGGSITIPPALQIVTSENLA